MSVVAVSALAALGGVVAYAALIFGAVWLACALSDRRRTRVAADTGRPLHFRHPRSTRG